MQDDENKVFQVIDLIFSRLSCVSLYLGNIFDVYPDGDDGGARDVGQVVLLVVHRHANSLSATQRVKGIVSRDEYFF